MAFDKERILHTRRVLERLRADVSAWIDRREKSDRQQQYVTQLGSLRKQLEFLLGEIGSQADGLEALAVDGDRAVYARCRKIDRRALWVERLFSYFQTKFDQRCDPRYQTLLEAADEVVWSCYAQPYAAVKSAKTPAVPLPFVASVYSPYAVPRDEPPQDLRSDVDAEFLSSMLQQIPIPVTALPPMAVDEPWWMAFLAHEVGHHVQFDFEDGAMIEWFGGVLQTAGGDRWAGWNKELFADTFSLLMIGHWALWALAELIWSDTLGMLDDTNPRYPCPLVRLVFMETLAGKLKLDATAGMRGLVKADLLENGPVLLKGRDLTKGAVEDLKAVDKVASAVAAAKYGAHGTMGTLCGFKAADFMAPKGRAHLWRRVFSGEGDLQPEKEVQSSRLVLSGGVAAWSGAVELAEAARNGQREYLARELQKRIVQERQEITREGRETVKLDLSGRNAKLGELLLREDIP